MDYDKLLSLLPDHEIHHIEDAEAEYQSSNHKFILFEYTIDNLYDTLTLLINNNIDYTIRTDSYNLQYILISDKYDFEFKNEFL
jgi:hypothetical protein